MMEAAIRDNQTKEILTIKSEYASKKAFREELNRNGYTVIGRITVEGEENEKTRLYDLGCK